MATEHQAQKSPGKETGMQHRLSTEPEKVKSALKGLHTQELLFSFLTAKQVVNLQNDVSLPEQFCHKFLSLHKSSLLPPWWWPLPPMGGKEDVCLSRQMALQMQRKLRGYWVADTGVGLTRAWVIFMINTACHRSPYLRSASQGQ